MVDYKVLLTKSSIAEPKNSFYGYYTLEESRQLLWLLFKMAISGRGNQISKKEWANLITFYENLDSFLQTCFKVNHQN